MKQSATRLPQKDFKKLSVIIYLIIILQSNLFLCFWTVSITFNRMVSFGVEDFEERYGGLKPSQFADMIALTGDRSDNIPGYFVSSISNVIC